MRSKKAFYGSITSLVYQVITVVCGLILPRLILVNFGSSYNGLTSSITQFLAGISLLKAGISGVAKAALFAPLHVVMITRSVQLSMQLNASCAGLLSFLPFFC